MIKPSHKRYYLTGTNTKEDGTGTWVSFSKHTSLAKAKKAATRQIDWLKSDEFKAIAQAQVTHMVRVYLLNKPDIVNNIRSHLPVARVDCEGYTHYLIIAYVDRS